MTTSAVRVVLLDATVDDRGELRRVAHARLAAETGATLIGRLCPRCAGRDHGRPWVRVEDGPAPHVSLSYAGRVVLLAWTWAGPVGVDVERAGTDAGVYGDLATWTRAEAVLKASGEGLLRDPTDLPDLSPLGAAPRRSTSSAACRLRWSADVAVLKPGGRADLRRPGRALGDLRGRRNGEPAAGRRADSALG